MKEQVMRILYRVIGIDEYGCSHIEQDGIESEVEANQELKHYESCWQDGEYYVEHYEYEHKEERIYNTNAVDGWEDMYPQYDENIY